MLTRRCPTVCARISRVLARSDGRTAKSAGEIEPTCAAARRQGGLVQSVCDASNQEHGPTPAIMQARLSEQRQIRQTPRFALSLMVGFFTSCSLDRAKAGRRPAATGAAGLVCQFGLLAGLAASGTGFGPPEGPAAAGRPAVALSPADSRGN